MKEVVYIDDEPVLCNVVQQILRTADIPARTFTSPTEGVAYVNTHPPALVICDYRMPELDGLEVLRQLREDVPFALLSGFLDLELDAALRQRVVEVLQKPLRAEALLDFVARFAG